MKLFLIIILLSFSMTLISAEENIESDNNFFISYNDSIQNVVNNASVNDKIYLNPGEYFENGIIVDKNLTFIGNGNSNEVIINGNFSKSIFIISTPVNVEFINITFINGYSYNYGGAIRSDTGRVYVDNCIFINNTAYMVNGGAIDNAGNSKTPGYLFVNNSIFVGNYAGHDGGAITTYYGTADIHNSIFMENYAHRDGGAVRGGIYSITNIYSCVFHNNTANEWGGAVYVWPGIGKIIDCNFTNNRAGEFGGAFTTSGQITVTGSYIANNYAGYAGGALYITEETPKIPSHTIFNNNIIINNTAKYYGDFVYIEETTSEKINFEDNNWGTNNPNWDKLLYTNNFTDNPIRFIITSNEETSNNNDNIINNPNQENTNDAIIGISNNNLNNSNSNTQGISSNENGLDFNIGDVGLSSTSSQKQNKEAYKLNVSKEISNDGFYRFLIILFIAIIFIVGYFRFKN